MKKQLKDGFIGESDVLKSLSWGEKVDSGLARVPFRTGSLVLRLEVASAEKKPVGDGREIRLGAGRVLLAASRWVSSLNPLSHQDTGILSPGCVWLSHSGAAASSLWRYTKLIISQTHMAPLGPNGAPAACGRHHVEQEEAGNPDGLRQEVRIQGLKPGLQLNVAPRAKC